MANQHQIVYDPETHQEEEEQIYKEVSFSSQNTEKNLTLEDVLQTIIQDAYNAIENADLPTLGGCKSRIDNLFMCRDITHEEYKNYFQNVSIKYTEQLDKLYEDFYDAWTNVVRGTMIIEKGNKGFVVYDLLENGNKHLNEYYTKQHKKYALFMNNKNTKKTVLKHWKSFLRSKFFKDPVLVWKTNQRIKNFYDQYESSRT